MLLFQELSGFLPCLFSLVGFVDHVLADGDFLLIDERVELAVDKVDEVGWELSCDIDELQHFRFLVHRINFCRISIIRQD